MASWISYAEALAIVTAQTGIADPKAALDGSIERGAVTFNDELSAVRTFPGGVIIVDEDAGGPTGVNRQDLDKWIATLKASAPIGRPTGSGKQITDAALVQRMTVLLKSKKANSRADAVKQICREDGTDHGASLEATIKRLSALYNANGE
jgi:hypothetical protein